ncbi:WbuC family cupin fold metalloprotein [Pseudoalteromonas sp. MSK9-3]|uniref:WbuC family cupin fold metalloprotein n=1 Tax=Pseudoalteromonas sp. MSK9-3 TaxID=1897633 RepID=UPI000E6B582F|nr:WbuC family cupin fold metalloprotein [Pseudoalteromonas sp. MSK9-3]
MTKQNHKYSMPKYLREESYEVYRFTEKYPFIRKDDLLFLKERANNSERKRARICLHESNHCALQEMVIALCKGTYVPPHKHEHKVESFTVLEGEARLIIFDISGTIISQLELSPNACKFCRIPENQFHTLVIISDIFVVVETTQGPFNNSGTENAKFAPTDQSLGLQYLNNIILN